jgi:ribosome assembly protein RRB1
MGEQQQQQQQRKIIKVKKRVTIA